MRTVQIPTPSQQSLPQWVAVVSPIGDQRRGLFFLPRDVAEDSFDQRDLSRRSRRGPACEWNSLAIRHHQPLSPAITSRRRRPLPSPTTTGRTAAWATRPPRRSRPGVLLPLRLRLRSSSTPGQKKKRQKTKCPLPNRYSHNPWTRKRGHPSSGAMMW